jgi:hypothetical protein
MKRLCWDRSSEEGSGKIALFRNVNIRVKLTIDKRLSPDRNLGEIDRGIFDTGSIVSPRSTYLDADNPGSSRDA